MTEWTKQQQQQQQQQQQKSTCKYFLFGKKAEKKPAEVREFWKTLLM